MLPVVMIQETMVINSDIHQINRGFFFQGVKDWLLENIFVYMHPKEMWTLTVVFKSWNMTGRIANRDEQMSSLDEQLFPNEIDEQRVATRWGLSTNQTNYSITFCHKIITFCPHLLFSSWKHYYNHQHHFPIWRLRLALPVLRRYHGRDGCRHWWMRKLISEWRTGDWKKQHDGHGMILHVIFQYCTVIIVFMYPSH